MIKKILLGLCVLAITIPLALFFSIKYSPISWDLVGINNEDNGIALKGYDPVSYFTDGKALKGDTSKGLKVNGVIYRFTSDENKLMFKTFPDRFLPQYGGYCATAVSGGFTADINPNIWQIKNDRLFLFFNDSAKNQFNDSLESNIAHADKSWKLKTP